MGIGFVMVAWLFIVGSLFIAWLVSFLLFMWGGKRKSWILKLFGGIPFGISSFIGILLVSFFCYAVFMAGLNLLSPSYVFYKTFGFAPTQDVKKLSGYCFGIADGSDTYLKFQAEPKTIDKIVNHRYNEVTESKFYEMIPYGEDDIDQINSWHVLNKQTSKYYVTNDFYNSTDKAILCYDTTSHWVYFHYWWIE